MAFLGKEQKSFCAVIPMNADMCMLNLWTIEFAAAAFYVFFTFFITPGYIYAKIYIKPIYRQTAIEWYYLFSIFFQFMLLSI